MYLLGQSGAVSEANNEQFGQGICWMSPTAPFCRCVSFQQQPHRCTKPYKSEWLYLVYRGQMPQTCSQVWSPLSAAQSCSLPGFRWKDFFWLSISSVFLPLPSSFQPREDVLSQHHYEEMAAFLGIRKAACFAFISYLVSNGFIQWVAEKGARGQSGQILNFHLTWKMRWECREIVNWLTWPQWQIWLSTKKKPTNQKKNKSSKIHGERIRKIRMQTEIITNRKVICMVIVHALLVKGRQGAIRSNVQQEERIRMFRRESTWCYFYLSSQKA